MPHRQERPPESRRVRLAGSCLFLLSLPLLAFAMELDEAVWIGAAVALLIVGDCLAFYGRWRRRNEPGQLEPGRQSSRS